MDLNDDAQLLSRSRAGDTGAYAQLYERHVGTALHVARQLSDDEAEDVVSDAFTRVYTILREGRGPDVAFRPYLLRTVRNTAIDRHRRTRHVVPRDDLEEAETPLLQEPVTGDPAIDRLEQQFVARAFRSLPERWQMVLWHTEVQGETPAQVAPLLGISPRAVAQLAVRAREGLRTAWLQEHVASAPPGHEEMVELLAAHIRGSLGLRGRRALESHLTECPGCRRLRDELDDVNSRLGVFLVPALLGLSVAELAWDASAAAATGAAAARGSGATTDDDAGGAVDQATDAAATPPAAPGTAEAAAGASASVGEAAAATSLVGSAASSGAAGLATLVHPVTAGIVAAAIVTTGVGAFVAVRDAQAPPASPSNSRTAPVTPSSSEDTTQTSPGSPAPSTPSGTAAPSGTATPSAGTPPSGTATPSAGTPVPEGGMSGSPSPSTSGSSSGPSTSPTRTSAPSTSGSGSPPQSPTSSRSTPPTAPAVSTAPAGTPTAASSSSSRATRIGGPQP